MVYVDPGKDMLVRPGQHVGVDGRVYHPYLRDWAAVWETSRLAEFLSLLQQVFEKEPPVISRAQQQQFQRPRGPQTQPQQLPGASPMPPRLPPKQTSITTGPTEMAAVDAPPPVPPKSSEAYAGPASTIVRDGPPLPPLPHELSPQHIQHSSFTSRSSPWQAPNMPLQTSSNPAPAPQNSGPARLSPFPPVAYQQVQQTHAQPFHRDGSPVSPITPSNGYSGFPETRYARSMPLSQQHLQQRAESSTQAAQYHPQQHLYQQQLQPEQAQHFGSSQPLPHMPLNQPPPPKQPLPDLLSDPFDVVLPGPSGPAAPAPPIPPNPEKEHLLQAISGTLVQQAQQRVNQTLSAIAPLQAQQYALRAAHEGLEGEIRQLEQLEQALSSNEFILRRSIQDCDRTIATAKSKKHPPIDDVLIAPTMVANQLWTLCAEDAACREAMYVLQTAFERGRVSGNDFVRQMRALGRESFMKMALARKCARGMGLEQR